MSETQAPSSLSAATRWRIVALLIGFTALGHLNREGMSVLGTEIFIDRLGISPTQMGLVYSTFLIVYTIGMLPCGQLTDRFGSGLVLQWFGTTMGTLVVLTGVLGCFTSDSNSLWLGLLVIRGLTGLSNSPLHPSRAHVVSVSIPKDSQATANGMATAGALLGIAYAYPILGWLMDNVGWQLIFLASGSALIAYSQVWRVAAIPLIPIPQSATAAQVASDRAAAWILLRHRNIWLLTLSYAAYGYFQYLFFYWMGYYFKDILHVSAIESRRAAFWIFLVHGAGMGLGGLSTDLICEKVGTIRGRRTMVIAGMGLAALFGFIGVNVTGFGNVVVCLALSVMVLGVCEGVFWTTATDIGGNARGFSGAFMNTGGNVGGFISPFLTPMLADQIGWPGAISVGCAIAALGGPVWFLIKLPEGATPHSAPDNAARQV